MRWTAHSKGEETDRRFADSDEDEQGQEGDENDSPAAQANTACAAGDSQRVRGEAIAASVSASEAFDLRVRTTSA